MHCTQRWRRGTGPEQRDGMRVKRKHNRRHISGARLLHQRGNHALMAKMHAIEITDGDKAMAIGGWVLETVLELHGD